MKKLNQKDKTSVTKKATTMSEKLKEDKSSIDPIANSNTITNQNQKDFMKHLENGNTSNENVQKDKGCEMKEEPNKQNQSSQNTEVNEIIQRTNLRFEENRQQHNQENATQNAIEIEEQNRIENEDERNWCYKIMTGAIGFLLFLYFSGLNRYG